MIALGSFLVIVNSAVLLCNSFAFMNPDLRLLNCFSNFGSPTQKQSGRKKLEHRRKLDCGHVASFACPQPVAPQAKDESNPST